MFMSSETPACEQVRGKRILEYADILKIYVKLPVSLYKKLYIVN